MNCTAIRDLFRLSRKCSPYPKNYKKKKSKMQMFWNMTLCCWPSSFEGRKCRHFQDQTVQVQPRFLVCLTVLLKSFVQRHSVTSQKTWIFGSTAVRTSDLTKCIIIIIQKFCITNPCYVHRFKADFLIYVWIFPTYLSPLLLYARKYADVGSALSCVLCPSQLALFYFYHIISLKSV